MSPAAKPAPTKKPAPRIRSAKDWLRYMQTWDETTRKMMR